ncbi:MAG: multicopper oxidase domain-containing protein [Desulfobacterales bacterium]|jgi:FtsP/CotA-like multicopper oxidase with cupredoxin domain|nr:multicopper oxidase domain-containing protein [Desulfobacterales bacterium]
MINHKPKRKFPEIILMGLIALAVMAGPAYGATYNLRAAQTTIDMPDGASVIMWGYALVSYDIGDGTVPGDNLITVPGPKLMVPAGQGLTVNLTNELSVPVSIIIPGQVGTSPPLVTRTPDGRIRSFTHETPAEGGSASYIWSNIKPGTYLYHSGTHPAVQVQMGLYGGVTKNVVEATADIPAQAYPDMPYNEEVMIIYSEIDPALHAAVADGTYGTPAYPSTIDYEPMYFLVNGVAADAEAPIAAINAGTTVLLRFLNAGLKDHAPEILGAHLSVIAEDGNLYPYPKQHYALLLAAGKTLDAVFSPPSTAATGNYPIFDRRAFRTNVATVKGAMHAYISVQALVP